MSVVGREVRFDTVHPQDFVDALYEEFYDLHPDGCEVDVAVVLERVGDEESPVMKIAAVKLFRVGPENSGEPVRFGPSEDEEPYRMLREIIEWGHSEGAGRTEQPFRSTFWAHKHPTGVAYATDKDKAYHEALVSIDFALGDGKHRGYLGGAVINRSASQPLHAAEVMPTQHGVDIEIDGRIAVGMLNVWCDQNDIPATDPLRVQGDKLARLAKKAGDEIRATGDATRETTVEVVTMAAQLLQAMAARQAAKTGGMGGLVEKLRAMGAPEALINEIANAQPQPQSLPQGRGILSLPQFQLPAADNTKPQIGFRPPVDRDRLN